MPGIPHDCDRLAEKLVLLHLRMFPRPFSSHATECIGIVGEGTSLCRFKSVPTSVIADRLAHARQTRISSWRLAYPILSYPVLFRVVSWLFSMFSGEFCLRLKPYLVVKIVSDVLTEHCCQVCILAMMFSRSTAGCVLACVVSDCAIRETPPTTCFGLLTCWHSDRPHGIWKIFFTFDFHILP